MRALLLAGVMVASWAGTATADIVYTDTWSFTDQKTNTLITGTLSGIQNGTGLSAYGLTATVTKSVYADMLGPYVIDPNGTGGGASNIYNAANGVVSFANFALKTSSNYFLYFGTNPPKTNFPEILNNNNFQSVYNQSVGMTFAAVPDTTTNVAEPATLALLGMGVVGIAAARRKRPA